MGRSRPGDDHLLYAALDDGVVQHVLRQVDATPMRFVPRSRRKRTSARTDVSLALPRCQSGIARRYDESRELGSSYVGPERALALARDEESWAGQLLQRFGISHTKLRGAVIRASSKGVTANEQTPTLTSTGATTDMAREGARPGHRPCR
jgi:ATP-dependent Clp protease ATP-binding subunit ClpC